MLKGKMPVFEIGEYVVCGNKGVCVIEKITTLDMPGVDKKRKYYILKPKYLSGSTVYIPTDSAGESIRRVLGREEAEKLITIIPKLPLLEIGNDKLSEQIYREHLKTGKCAEWVKILKTVYVRKQRRQQEGRKITAVDAKYFRAAEESLYGELAVALDMQRSEAEECVMNRIEEGMECHSVEV